MRLRLGTIAVLVGFSAALTIPTAIRAQDQGARSNDQGAIQDSPADQSQEVGGQADATTRHHSHGLPPASTPVSQPGHSAHHSPVSVTPPPSGGIQPNPGAGDPGEGGDTGVTGGGGPMMSPDNCSWSFAGKARKAVKLRVPSDGAGYFQYNHGNPITLDTFFSLACQLDGRVPLPVPESTPMAGIETQKISIQCYLLAVRFELSGDHDFHCEVGGKADWNCPHLIVEVPPGQSWCDPRQSVWSMVQNDLRAAHGDSTSTIWVMQRPRPIIVTGFLFLDAPHITPGMSDYCHNNGGRGIQRPGFGSMVQGLWELHPVISIADDPSGGAR